MLTLQNSLLSGNRRFLLLADRFPWLGLNSKLSLSGVSSAHEVFLRLSYMGYAPHMSISGSIRDGVDGAGGPPPLCPPIVPLCLQSVIPQPGSLAPERSETAGSSTRFVPPLSLCRLHLAQGELRRWTWTWVTPTSPPWAGSPPQTVYFCSLCSAVTLSLWVSRGLWLFPEGGRYLTEKPESTFTLSSFSLLMLLLM